MHIDLFILGLFSAPLFTAGFYGYFYDKDLDHNQHILPEAAVTYILVFTFLQLLIVGPLAFSELYLNFALKESVDLEEGSIHQSVIIHAPYWIWILLMLYLMFLILVIFIKFPGRCYTIIAI